MLQLLTALVIAVAPAVIAPPALPPCLTDEIGPDVPPCYWSASTRGNGLGESFTWSGGTR